MLLVSEEGCSSEKLRTQRGNTPLPYMKFMSNDVVVHPPNDMVVPPANDVVPPANVPLNDVVPRLAAAVHRRRRMLASAGRRLH